jgi:hypothetical protein
MNGQAEGLGGRNSPGLLGGSYNSLQSFCLIENTDYQTCVVFGRSVRPN